MTKEEISKEIKECEERLAKLREEMDRSEYGGKRWKPKKGEPYYCIFPDGNIVSFPFENGYDLYIYTRGNGFKTQEEAEFEGERQKVIAELKDFAEGDDAVWNGRKFHYYIYYDYYNNRIEINYIVSSRCAELYFPSGEAARAAIEAVGEERVKKYYLGMKE